MRRLLEEVQPEVVTQVAKGGRKTALALLIALPLAASAGYLILGNPQAFAPQQAQADITPQQIDDMLNKLAAKLKKNPDDHQGWMMLARSYKVLGRYPEAVEAYSHGGALLDSDAALLADESAANSELAETKARIGKTREAVTELKRKNAEISKAIGADSLPSGEGR